MKTIEETRKTYGLDSLIKENADNFEWAVMSESGKILAVFRLQTPALDFVNLTYKNSNYQDKYHVCRVKLKKQTKINFIGNNDETITL